MEKSFSSDGTYLAVLPNSVETTIATVGRDANLAIWNPSRLGKPNPMLFPPVRSIWFAPDGKHFLSYSSDVAYSRQVTNRLYLHETSTLERVAELTGGSGSSGLQFFLLQRFLEDNKTLVTVAERGPERVLEVLRE